MNVQSFLKREMSQWLVLEQQPSLQSESQSTTALPKTPTIWKDGKEMDCYTANLLGGKLAVTVPLVLRSVAPQAQSL
ncbi:MAG TPA: hypothetical protein VEC37_17470, partial [Bacillota bacterium]|nr:hypothetical protein [Bacillota bacterium]